MQLTNIFWLVLVTGFASGSPLELPSGVSIDKHRLGIINGSYALIAMYPYMAALTVYGRLAGVGVIIDKEWILTTASTTRYDWEDIKFQVGSSVFGDYQEVFRVRKVVRHEKFSPSTYNYDIALINLMDEITFDVNKNAATLGTEELQNGTKATVLGWGQASSSTTSSTLLLSTEVTVMDWDTCRDEERKLTTMQICTFDQYTGPCKNDYGAPLVINGSVYGLFSKSANCLPGNSPLIYTDVTQLTEWVKENMK